MIHEEVMVVGVHEKELWLDNLICEKYYNGMYGTNIEDAGEWRDNIINETAVSLVYKVVRHYGV